MLQPNHKKNIDGKEKNILRTAKLTFHCFVLITTQRQKTYCYCTNAVQTPMYGNYQRTQRPWKMLPHLLSTNNEMDVNCNLNTRCKHDTRKRTWNAKCKIVAIRLRGFTTHLSFTTVCLKSHNIAESYCAAWPDGITCTIRKSWEARVEISGDRLVATLPLCGEIFSEVESEQVESLLLLHLR